MADSPFVGGSYDLASRPASVQRTINLMPVPLEPGNERTSWVFRDVPGLVSVTIQVNPPCTEGPVWAATTLNTSAAWSNIVWDQANGKFIATGILAGQGIAAYSADFGVSWTNSSSNPIVFSGGGVGFKYNATKNNGAGLTLGFGDGVIIGSSSNGTSWAQPTLATFAKDSLSYANGVWIARNDSTSTTAYTSPDGTTWTARTLPSSQQWVDGAYDTELDVWSLINQTSLTTARSTDQGVTWAAGGSLPAGFGSNPVWRIAYGDGTLVAIPGTNYGFFAYSTNGGTTWTATGALPSLPATTLWNDIYFADGVFMATSTSAAAGVSLMAISVDGITWATAVNQLPNSVNVNWRVAHDGAGHYAALGSGAGVIAAYGLC